MFKQTKSNIYIYTYICKCVKFEFFYEATTEGYHANHYQNETV